MTSHDFMEIGLGVGAMGSPLVALLLGQLNLKQSKANGVKIAEVHRSTNGKMEELLALTAKASKAEGVEEERTKRPDPPHSLPDSELPPTWPEKPK